MSTINNACAIPYLEWVVKDKRHTYRYESRCRVEAQLQHDGIAATLAKRICQIDEMAHLTERDASHMARAFDWSAVVDDLA